MKWVCELPFDIQNEILRECGRITTELCGDDINLYEVVNNVMQEKLVNIIGYEKGLLDADKYYGYLKW